LDVLANGSIGLAELVRLVQYFFVKGEKGLVWEEDCSLVNTADISKELGEVEALNRHGI